MSATVVNLEPLTFEELLGYFEGVKRTSEGKATVLCPAHDDHNPSLDITIGRERYLFCCRVGCSFDAICKAGGVPRERLGLNGHAAPKRRDPRTIVKTYDYTDAAGRLLFQVVRYRPKDFKQRRPDGNGGWIWNMNGAERVLYRLPEIIGADKGVPLFVCEGEKDSDNARALGLVATTCPMGAGKWSKVEDKPLQGRNVVIVPHADEKGEKHLNDVASRLHGRAVSVRVLRLPIDGGQKDVSDFIEERRAGGMDDAAIRRELLDLAAAAPLWEPAPVTAPRAGKAPHRNAEPVEALEPSSTVAPNYDPVTGLDYDTEIALTETGNARRFAGRHADDVRYCPALGWLVWDGTRWAPDETGRAVELAKDQVRELLAEIVDAPLEKDRQKLGRWALQSASLQKIEAMLKLARSDTRLVVRHRQLDADPWLLNCPNGTIDLRTGELREHRREDYITKRTAAPYNPEAESARWDRFLRETTGGDLELLEFSGRALGYSITGGTAEEVLFLVHGPTAAGKSTFIESIRAGLGDYCRTADFSTFLRRRGDGPRNDIARLAGSRIVVSIEVEEGRQLAEGLVKSLTGGDTVAARFLYRESFEFKPAFKLWLVCNDAPRVSADDSAIWRRMLRLPFDRTVPEADRDPTLKAGFCDPDGEDAGAILAWCVAGCLEYQRRGLDVPERVKLATAEYRADQDLVARFLEDRCHTDDRNAETLATGLYKAFRQFCKEAGEVAPSQTTFGRSLTEKGHQSKRAGSGRMVRKGIELRQENTLAGPQEDAPCDR